MKEHFAIAKKGLNIWSSEMNQWVQIKMAVASAQMDVPAWHETTGVSARTRSNFTALVGRVILKQDLEAQLHLTNFCPSKIGVIMDAKQQCDARDAALQMWRDRGTLATAKEVAQKTAALQEYCRTQGLASLYYLTAIGKVEEEELIANPGVPFLPLSTCLENLIKDVNGLKSDLETVVSSNTDLDAAALKTKQNVIKKNLHSVLVDVAKLKGVKSPKYPPILELLNNDLRSATSATQHCLFLGIGKTLFRKLLPLCLKKLRVHSDWDAHLEFVLHCLIFKTENNTQTQIPSWLKLKRFVHHKNWQSENWIALSKVLPLVENVLRTWASVSYKLFFNIFWLHFLVTFSTFFNIFSTTLYTTHTCDVCVCVLFFTFYIYKQTDTSTKPC